MLSCVTGGMLALVYDLLRAVRRKVRGLISAALADLFFWIIAGAALFTLGMSAGGGQLRIFMLVFALIGAVLYFATLSRYVLNMCDAVFNLLGKIAKIISRPLWFFIQKTILFKNYLKKLFQKFLTCVKMRYAARRAELTASREQRRSEYEQSRSTRKQKNSSGDTYETQTSEHNFDYSYNTIGIIHYNNDHLFNPAGAGGGADIQPTPPTSGGVGARKRQSLI